MLAAAAVIAVGVGLHRLSFGTWVELRQAWQDEAGLKREIEQIKLDNAVYEEEIEDYEHNGPALMRRAREVLGVARPGEVIVKIPEKQ